METQTNIWTFGIFYNNSWYTTFPQFLSSFSVFALSTIM